MPLECCKENKQTTVKYVYSRFFHSKKNTEPLPFRTGLPVTKFLAKEDANPVRVVAIGIKKLLKVDTVRFFGSPKKSWQSGFILVSPFMANALKRNHSLKKSIISYSTACCNKFLNKYAIINLLFPKRSVFLTTFAYSLHFISFEFELQVNKWKLQNDK